MASQYLDGFDPWEVVEPGVIRLVHTNITIVRSLEGRYQVNWNGRRQAGLGEIYSLDRAKKDATKLVNELLVMGDEP